MLAIKTVQQVIAAISAICIVRAYQFGVDGLSRARASRSVFEVAIYDDVVIVLEPLGKYYRLLSRSSKVYATSNVKCIDRLFTAESPGSRHNATVELFPLIFYHLMGVIIVMCNVIMQAEKFTSHAS